MLASKEQQRPATRPADIGAAGASDEELPISKERQGQGTEGLSTSMEQHEQATRACRRRRSARTSEVGFEKEQHGQER